MSVNTHFADEDVCSKSSNLRFSRLLVRVILVCTENNLDSCPPLQVVLQQA